jgi:selenocysteine lyase/cysteine desulfurase
VISLAGGTVAPFTTIEQTVFRADAPALFGQHYFAHGSASFPPRTVFDAQMRWLQLEQAKGTHAALRELEPELDEVRGAVAALIGAQAHQIALLGSASRAWASTFLAALDAGFGRTTVTSVHEWGGNALNLLHARSRWRIDHLCRLDASTVPLADSLEVTLRQVAEPRQMLVSLPLLPTASGMPLDLADVAQLVHEQQGLLMVDASHAVGHLPIDVKALDCDVMVFPARKWLRGPKGIAVLYLSDRALSLLGAPPMLDVAGARFQGPESYVVQEDARRFETFDHSPGVRLGLKAACEYARDVGIERIAATNRSIANTVAQRLADRFGVAPLETEPGSAMLNYAITPALRDELLENLLDKDISASIVDAAYAPWWFGSAGHSAQLRLTPNYLTSEEDIDRLVEVITVLPNDTFLRSTAAA